MTPRPKKSEDEQAERRQSTVYFTREEQRALKMAAADRETSVTEIVAQAIRKHPAVRKFLK